jgi:hypothetical protein
VSAVNRICRDGRGRPKTSAPAFLSVKPGLPGARQGSWPKRSSPTARSYRAGRSPGKPWMARRKRSAQGQPALPRRERGALISAGMRWRPFAHNADWAGAQRRTADGAASAAHPSLRMSARHSAALAATAAAPDLGRYVERPPIAEDLDTHLGEACGHLDVGSTGSRRPRAAPCSDSSPRRFQGRAAGAAEACAG